MSSSQVTIKNVAASGKKKRVGKFTKKSRASTALVARRPKQDAMVLPRGFGQTILAERLRTWVTTSMQFYIAANNIDQTNGNYMSFKLNSTYVPFGTTYTPVAVTPSFSMNGQYVQGFSGLTEAIGNSFANSAYERYKVLGYKVKVSIMTSTNSDLLEAVLVPLGTDQTPSTTLNCNIMKGQPKSVSKIVHNGGPNNVLWLKGSAYELVGQRKAQWEDSAPAPVNSDPTFTGYAGLFLQSLNGATNNQPVVIDITMYQFVEYTDLNNQNFLA